MLCNKMKYYTILVIEMAPPPQKNLLLMALLPACDHLKLPDSSKYSECRLTYSCFVRTTEN
jgi:hypothetical protein